MTEWRPKTAEEIANSRPPDREATGLWTDGPACPTCGRPEFVFRYHYLTWREPAWREPVLRDPPVAVWSVDGPTAEPAFDVVEHPAVTVGRRWTEYR